MASEWRLSRRTHLLDKRDVAHGAEGVDELEDEDLADQRVFVLGLCAVVLPAVQPHRDAPEQRVQRLDLQAGAACARVGRVCACQLCLCVLLLALEWAGRGVPASQPTNTRFSSQYNEMLRTTHEMLRHSIQGNTRGNTDNARQRTRYPAALHNQPARSS